MNRSVIIGTVVVLGLGAGTYYLTRNGGSEAAARQNQGGGNFGGGGGFGGGGRGGGFGGPRLPMTVELSAVKRADMAQQITVVGNLVGDQTVAAVPKISGRLEAVSVRMGDRVKVGQRLAKIEDRELLEQVKQAEASYAVSAATIRQREADLGLAKTNLERSQNLFQRQLIPRQTYDDAEARFQAAQAQLDLARAQHAQAQARLDELKINLSNTVIASPVNGFVGSRTLDPGAWVTPNTAFISVVDIDVVRLVANVVEKDLRRIQAGLKANVEVDAFPGEKFVGEVAHVAPVLDPATRTAQIEVEIPNPNYRLKPGMYARVQFTVDQRENTLVVPTSAIVDVRGSRGVFQLDQNEQGGRVARFKPIEIGLSDQNLVEVMAGLREGEQIISTGAAALREGDRVVLPGEDPSAAAAGGRTGGGQRGSRGEGRGRRGEGGSGDAATPSRGGPAPAESAVPDITPRPSSPSGQL